MSDFNPDAFLAQQPEAPPIQNNNEPTGFDPDAFIDNLNQEQYGTTGQQFKAGLEGVARGVAGPLAPMLEKSMGVKPEDIRGRAEANPVTHGLGEAVGLVGGALTGTGEAALMGKAGEAAVALSGLSKAGEAASLGSRVGSEAIKQAAEMAVLQGSDETSKMVLQDPHATAQTAIANIGLSAALGAGGGAFTAGVLSPLWKATVGPKLEKALSGLSDHLNGNSKLMMPEQLENAAKELGITISPATRAAMSGDPKAMQLFNELREAQHPTIIQDIEGLHKMASDSVMQSLRMAPEDIEAYSENEAGHNLREAFLKEYKAKYGPVSEALEQRNVKAATIAVPDEARLQRYGKIIEEGMARFGTDSPYYKLYDEYGNRLLAKDTIGGMDQLKTEIYGRAKSLANDDNTKQALHHIGSLVKDFQEQQIERSAARADVEALKRTNVAGQPRVNVGEIPSAKTGAADTLAQRQAANQGYAQFSQMSDDLIKHLGLGEFRGYKTLVDKLTDKKSAEQLLNAFSPRGDADLIPFLAKNFPETLEHVRQNELKKIIKPSILSAKGEHPVNVKKLTDIVEKMMSGQKEYINFAMPQGSIQKIQAANSLINAIPAFKSSGTAGWTSKLYKNMPASAMAAVAWLTGHGPLAGYVGGHFAQILGRDAPDAIKLALLRFMAADQPIKSEGFKAMVDFMHNTYKGETMMAKAAANVFKPGFQVFTDAQMPSKAELIKLDKLVADNQKTPNDFVKSQQASQVGHYLPQHQSALTEATSQQLQYLQQLKPHPFKPGPLDSEIPPTPEQEARYNRALTIAQQPMTVLQHIKDGTLQATDIQDFKAMYPAVYARTMQNLANEMVNRHADEEPIPYKTRVGISLFLGQPLDSSMLPASIIAAQPKPKPAQQQEAQGKTKKGTATLGKSNKMYRTSSQSAEVDRAGRD